MSTLTRRTILCALPCVGAVVLAALWARPTGAQTIRSSDIATVFFIAKSDDRNRVDYGVRVNERCRPDGNAPMFGYWRRFEPNQPPLGDLNAMDRSVYGIASQRVRTRAPGGTWIEMRLAALSDERVLTLVRPREGGGCDASARVTLQGHELLLDHLFVQLGGLSGVDHVTVFGTDASTGRERRVRLDPPRQLPGI
ncbi:MAG: DUF4833 domain-containing protein [Sandaracinaceae bacterium]